MPQVRVAIWNVETFGQNTSEHRGVDSAHLAVFIRAVIRHYDLDALIILEAMSTCEPALLVLADCLNEGRQAGDRMWCCDLIRGALIDGLQGEPTGPADTSFNGGLRHEGYIVVWREAPAPAAPLPFQMALPPRDISLAPGPWGRRALDLVTLGRRTQFVDHNGQRRQEVAGYSQASPAPLYPIYDGGVDTWQPLDFIPSAGIYDAAVTGSWTRSRRPCTCTLLLDLPPAAGGSTPVPIVAFHAPVTDYKREAATYRCTLSRQLYVTPEYVGRQPQADTRQVAQYALAGGDFNVQAQLDLGAAIFGGFTRAFNTDTARLVNWNDLVVQNVGGAGMRTDLPQDAGTVVRPDLPESVDGDGTQSTAYLTLPIDRPFSRQPAAAHVQIRTERLNLLQLVYDGTSAHIRQGVQAFEPAVQAELRRVTQSGAVRMSVAHGPYKVTRLRDGEEKHSFVFTWSRLGHLGIPVERWYYFQPGIRAGVFAGQGGEAAHRMRAAAEFLRILISDHLPLMFTLQWPDP